MRRASLLRRAGLARGALPPARRRSSAAVHSRRRLPRGRAPGRRERLRRPTPRSRAGCDSCGGRVRCGSGAGDSGRRDRWRPRGRATASRPARSRSPSRGPAADRGRRSSRGLVRARPLAPSRPPCPAPPGRRRRDARCRAARFRAPVLRAVVRRRSSRSPPGSRGSRTEPARTDRRGTRGSRAAEARSVATARGSLPARARHAGSRRARARATGTCRRRARAEACRERRWSRG